MSSGQGSADEFGRPMNQPAQPPPPEPVEEAIIPLEAKRFQRRSFAGWLADLRNPLARHRHHYVITECWTWRPAGFGALGGTWPQTVVVLMCWCHSGADAITTVTIPGEYTLAALRAAKALAMEWDGPHTAPGAGHVQLVPAPPS